MPSDIANTSDNETSHKLSTVVTFRGRDLVMPKGIDGGEMLAWASADELLAHHLELASDARTFWKDGFLLYTLWAMGDFCGVIPPGKAFQSLSLYSERFLSISPRSRLADQPEGGQPPHQGIPSLQPVWCDDHPDGRKGRHS